MTHSVVRPTHFKAFWETPDSCNYKNKNTDKNLIRQICLYFFSIKLISCYRETSKRHRRHESFGNKASGS